VNIVIGVLVLVTFGVNPFQPYHASVLQGVYDCGGRPTVKRKFLVPANASEHAVRGGQIQTQNLPLVDRWSSDLSTLLNWITSPSPSPSQPTSTSTTTSRPVEPPPSVPTSTPSQMHNNIDIKRNFLSSPSFLHCLLSPFCGLVISFLTLTLFSSQTQSQSTSPSTSTSWANLAFAIPQLVTVFALGLVTIGVAPFVSVEQKGGEEERTRDLDGVNPPKALTSGTEAEGDERNNSINNSIITHLTVKSQQQPIITPIIDLLAVFNGVAPPPTFATLSLWATTLLLLPYGVVGPSKVLRTTVLPTLVWVYVMLVGFGWWGSEGGSLGQVSEARRAASEARRAASEARASEARRGRAKRGRRGSEGRREV